MNTSEVMKDRLLRPWYQRPDESLWVKSIISREDSQQFFLPSIWLSMSAIIQEAQEVQITNLESNEWLSEFTRQEQLDGWADFVPTKFSRSQLEFKTAPDEMVLRLEQYNRDLQVREMTEEMLMFASSDASRALAYEVLLAKVAGVIDGAKRLADRHDIVDSFRSRRLKKALDNNERTQEGKGSEMPSITKSAINKFLKTRVDQHNLGEASSE